MTEQSPNAATNPDLNSDLTESGPCHELTADSGHVAARAIEGASADSTASLPMIVWLRGDEPYAEDFNLDAEAAMATLGIKRSRLTQISGKELRVGRKRIDRYVRPVYRTEDIEEYQGWTRATATHQRSSSAIKEAADELRQHSQELTDTFMEAIESQQQDTKQTVSEIVNETYRLQQETQTSTNSTLQTQHKEISAILANHQAELIQSLHNMQNSLSAFATKQLQREDRYDTNQKNFTEVISGQFADYEHALNSVRDHQTAMKNDFEQLVEATREHAMVQTRFNRNLAEALTKSLEAQREMSLKVDALLNPQIHEGSRRQPKHNLHRLRKLSSPLRSKSRHLR